MFLRAYGGPLDGKLVNLRGHFDFYMYTDNGTRFVRHKYEARTFVQGNGDMSDPVFVLVPVLVLSGYEMPSEHQLVAVHEVLN